MQGRLAHPNFVEILDDFVEAYVVQKMHSVGAAAFTAVSVSSGGRVTASCSSIAQLEAMACLYLLGPPKIQLSIWWGNSGWRRVIAPTEFNAYLSEATRSTETWKRSASRADA